MSPSNKSEKSSQTPAANDEESFACILCGSTKSAHHITAGKSTYSKCESCGLVFQNPITVDAISENLAAFSSATEHYARKESGSRRAKYYRKYLRLIEKYLALSHRKTEKSLLEIGCGAGGFLSAAKDLGWKVTGTEICENLASIAREKFGLNVLLEDISSLNLPPESFNVAALNMVIEHLQNPFVTLKEVNRLLRAGGVLLVHTPNYAGKVIEKSRSDEYFPSSHIFLFTPATLAALVQKANFIVRTVTTSGFKFTRSNFLLKPLEKLLGLYYCRKLRGHRLRVIAQKP